MKRIFILIIFTMIMIIPETKTKAFDPCEDTGLLECGDWIDGNLFTYDFGDGCLATLLFQYRFCPYPNGPVHMQIYAMTNNSSTCNSHTTVELFSTATEHLLLDPYWASIFVPQGSINQVLRISYASCWSHFFANQEIHTTGVTFDNCWYSCANNDCCLWTCNVEYDPPYPPYFDGNPVLVETHNNCNLATNPSEYDPVVCFQFQPSSPFGSFTIPIGYISFVSGCTPFCDAMILPRFADMDIISNIHIDMNNIIYDNLLKFNITTSETNNYNIEIVDLLGQLLNHYSIKS